MKNRVRRFDIFAIMNYLKNTATMDEDRAKGEAIWLAKLIANRKLYGHLQKAKADTEIKDEKTGKVQLWKSLSGIAQTNVEYDKAITERFGADYPDMVEAIKSALASGLSYNEIRDCKHATGGRNSGWCNECSQNFIDKFAEEFKGKLVA